MALLRMVYQLGGADMVRMMLVENNVLEEVIAAILRDLGGE